MPALDFPASPTNGQVYANWIYSTSKGAWQAKPITGKVTTSAVAPSAPTNGDEWFNTNDGNLYVYYTDVDGSQWVQVKSDATLSSTLGNRVTSLETYPAGLVSLVPASITVASGSASVAADGLITFTSVPGLSINGIFNSTYRNYRIDFAIDSSGGGNGSIAARMRNAGTDRGTLDYITSGLYMYAAGSIGSYNATTSGYDVGYSYQSVTSYSTFSFEVLDPAKPSRTKLRSWNVGLNSNGQASSFHTSCLHNVDQTHDGITIYGTGTTPTYTGTARIYGFR